MISIDSNGNSFELSETVKVSSNIPTAIAFSLTQPCGNAVSTTLDRCNAEHGHSGKRIWQAQLNGDKPPSHAQDAIAASFTL
jgi:hypothetical protein